MFLIYVILRLTEVAGEGGPDLAPQKFLLSQKFRHLMRCKKYLENFFKHVDLSSAYYTWAKLPPDVWEGSPVKFFEVSY